MTSFSLWRHSCVSRLRRSQPPFSLCHHSHYHVIRYWAGHAQRYGRTYVTYGHVTAFNRDLHCIGIAVQQKLLIPS